MAEIKSKNFEITWVLSGWRFSIEQAGIKRSIKRKILEYDAPFVCVTRKAKKVTANFSKTEGYDFGATLAAELNYAHYVYLDVREEGIVYVWVKDHEVLEDRVILELDEAINNLSTFTDNLAYEAKREQSLRYVIEVTGNLQKDFEAQLTRLEELGHSITRLERSKLDTLEPVEHYRFEPESAALRKLTDRKAQWLVIGAIGGLTLLGGSVYWFWPEPKPEVKVVTVDHWQAYRDLMFNSGISPIPRLLQDLHTIDFIDTVPRWELARIVHSQGAAPRYFIRSPQHGVFRELRASAQSAGYRLLHTQEGIVLSTQPNNFPPFYLFKQSLSAEQQVGVVVPVAHQYEALKDDLAHLSQGVFVGQPTVIEQPSADGQVRWGSYRVNLVLTHAFYHDLYRIIAVLSRLNATLVQADVEIREGQFQGTYVVDLHGSIENV